MGDRPAGGDKGAVRLVGLEVEGRGCSVQSLPRKPGEPIQQSSWAHSGDPASAGVPVSTPLQQHHASGVPCHTHARVCLYD